MVLVLTGSLGVVVVVVVVMVVMVVVSPPCDTL